MMSDQQTLSIPEEKLRTPETHSGGRALPWFQIAWFSILLVTLYARVLAGMVKDWFTAAEMVHGVFVPMMVGYLVWRRRHTILNTPAAPSWWGLLAIAWGFIQLLLGTLGADFFLARVSFLVALAGLLWTAGGRRLLRALVLPLSLSVFMIRLPLFFFRPLAATLQDWAVRLAVDCLAWVRIPVVRNASILEIVYERQVRLLEAGAGVRYLYTILFLACLYALVFERRTWIRAALGVTSILITVLAVSATTVIRVLSIPHWPSLLERGPGILDHAATIAFAAIILVTLHTFSNLVITALCKASPVHGGVRGQ